MSSYFSKLIDGLKSVSAEDLISLRNHIIATLERRGKVIVAGNGGSSAVTQHWAVDWNTVRVETHCLGTNSGRLTAASNDVGYAYAYRIEMERIVRSEDLLICLSCSGSSPNIQKCLEFARMRKIPAILVTGNMYEPMEAGEYTVRIDSTDYGVIEDVGAAIGHYITNAIEEYNEKPTFVHIP